MRDGGTAGIGIHAALTGHLVLSTLHTNTAAGAIPRLLDMGIDAFLLASSLRCVIGQRLVRVLCPHCKEECEPEPEQALFKNISRHPRVAGVAKGWLQPLLRYWLRGSRLHLGGARRRRRCSRADTPEANAGAIERMACSKGDDDHDSRRVQQVPSRHDDSGRGAPRRTRHLGRGRRQARGWRTSTTPRSAGTRPKLAGEMEAGTRDSVVAALHKLGHFPINVSEASAEQRPAAAPHDPHGFEGKPSTSQVTLFTRELAILLKAGLPLDQSLALLEHDAGSKRVRQLIGALAEQIKNGKSLHEAMAMRPASFPPVYANMVRVAEASGTLDTVLARIAQTRERAERCAARLCRSSSIRAC